MERSAPTILFFKEIPIEERIAEIRRQNSKIPEQRKDRIIGSFKVETKIVDVLVTESKTNVFALPKTDNKALEKKPKK